jgi:hypothetical protein
VHTLRSFSGILLTCALAAGVSGCSVFENSSAPPAPVAPSVGAAPTAATGGSGSSSDSAENQIAANWTTFFFGHTTAAKRETLVQDGPQFLPTMEAQAGGTMTAESLAQVTKVTLTSASQANVSYSILLAGQPALPNQTGIAVLEDGVWKVSAVTFCNLLSLENGGSKSGLPSVCQTAGSAG